MNHYFDDFGTKQSHVLCTFCVVSCDRQLGRFLSKGWQWCGNPPPPPTTHTHTHTLHEHTHTHTHTHTHCHWHWHWDRHWNCTVYKILHTHCKLYTYNYYYPVYTCVCIIVYHCSSHCLWLLYKMMPAVVHCRMHCMRHAPSLAWCMKYRCFQG